MDRLSREDRQTKGADTNMDRKVSRDGSDADASWKDRGEATIAAALALYDRHAVTQREIRYLMTYRRLTNEQRERVNQFAARLAAGDVPSSVTP